MWEKSKKRVASGQLFRNLPVFDSFDKAEKPFASYPFSILISQACDIDQYCEIYKPENETQPIADRQAITQVLFCPAFEEDFFFAGTHLEKQYKLVFPPLSNKEKEKYRANHIARFHFIPLYEAAIPNLIIDFKHYFTLPARFVFSEAIRPGNDIKLKHLQYTSLADRFAYYLQRVALPSQPEDDSPEEAKG